MSESFLSRRQAVAALAAGAALPLVSGCAPRVITTAPPPPSGGVNTVGDAVAEIFIRRAGESLLALYPESATSLGVDKGQWAHLRSQLTDRSAAGQMRIAALVREDLKRAEALNVSGLDHSRRTTIEVIKSAYRIASDGFALPYGDVAVGGWRNTPYVVIQNVGAYLDIPRFLDSDHPINDASDAEAYLARLQSYPDQLAGELARIKAARAIGLVPPAFLLDKAIVQLEQSAQGAREGGLLVESIVRRTREKNIAGNWGERAMAVATKEVAPALERQIAELKAERAIATNDAGMWARPQGDEYYRWALRASTTTTMSPDEIHQLGIDTVRSLHGRMDPILRSIGYTQGSVGARMQALLKDPRYRFADDDQGRAEVMAFIEERLKIIRAKMPEAFNTLVRGNVEVRRLPPEEEPGAPGAYGGAGSIDGTIPGKFWINLKPGFEHTRYDLPSLTHHEAIPGHVWQGEYANQLPLIRTLLSFNAYSEGWGLYAEQLADELGVYDDFEIGRLGYLNSIAFRAARLVVDTGLHAKRWSRQQARQYFLEAVGDPNESEVDRYCSWPGQACGYEIGHQEINRQRARARAALGQRFDIKAFNDAVVIGGNVPMDVLAKNVGEYVETAGGSVSA